MELVELLIVKDCFDISGLGVVVIPDFPVPKGAWNNQVVTVDVETPDGARIRTTARLDLTHFNLSDPQARADERWRIVLSLPDYTKATLPPGSKIFVSRDVAEALQR